LLKIKKEIIIKKNFFNLKLLQINYQKSISIISFMRFIPL